MFDFNSLRTSNKVFFVAEIGQNHQGSLETAKQMISEAKKIGCDCVKFQKSYLPEKFTTTALERSYETENSWGKTYGEHKEFLEFSIEEMLELKNFADSQNILFSASAMDEVSLEQLLTKMQLPFLKIGSGDANNFRLIRKAASQKEIPLIISTGMQTIETIEKIVEILEQQEKHNVCLLHCISSYPTEPKDANLYLITVLRKKFSYFPIGYSGHEMGTLLSKAAILLGSKVVERHFTLDKMQKGSDHKASLLPSELKDLIDFSRKMNDESDSPKQFTPEEIVEFLGENNEEFKNDLRLALQPIETRRTFESEIACRQKLGKSIVYTRELLAGQALNAEDLSVKVAEPFGISAEYLERFVGSILKTDVKTDDILLEKHLL